MERHAEASAGPLVSRRDAMRRLGLGMAGLAVGAGLWPRGSAAAPSVGGRPERPEEGSPTATGRPMPFGPLGLQLYSVRDQMELSVPETLEAVASMGYTEVEFAGYFGHPPADIRGLLTEVGLTAPAAHVPPEFDPDAWARILDEAAAVGHQAVVVAWIPEEMRVSADAWRRTAAAMARAGEAAREAGLRFGYHNHDFEFMRFGGAPDEPTMAAEGPTGVEILASETEPGDVLLELDIFWTAHAGFDPVSTLQRFADRVRMVHVKDRTADGRMVDVGAGDLDWPRILGACRDVGVEHFFVEHDRPEDGSLRFARESAAYLAGVGVG